jgi:hypothetical protein
MEIEKGGEGRRRYRSVEFKKHHSIDPLLHLVSFSAFFALFLTK